MPVAYKADLNMHIIMASETKIPKKSKLTRITLLLAIATAALFTAQPIAILCVTPLHINDREARDQAYHDRRRTCLSPDPETCPEAVVQIFAARAWGIRGVFAEHTWIALKPKNASAYTVCHVKGWLLIEQGISPLEIQEGIPDEYWMGSPARLVLDLRGQAAERAISDILRAVSDYPYKKQYHLFPGPNSNTFTAHIVRNVPQLNCVLPVTAIGRDYLPEKTFISRTPSNTGYQVSVRGLASVSAARKEGLEISLLGLTLRIDIQGRRIYLPGSNRPVLNFSFHNNEVVQKTQAIHTVRSEPVCAS